MDIFMLITLISILFLIHIIGIIIMTIIDMVKFYKIYKNELNQMVPTQVDVLGFINEAQIKHKYHGKGQFGFIVNSNDKEYSMFVSEESYNKHSIGDTIMVNIEEYLNLKTNEIMEDRTTCRLLIPIVEPKENNSCKNL